MVPKGELKSPQKRPKSPPGEARRGPGAAQERRKSAKSSQGREEAQIDPRERLPGEVQAGPRRSPEPPGSPMGTRV